MKLDDIRAIAQQPTPVPNETLAQALKQLALYKQQLKAATDSVTELQDDLLSRYNYDTPLPVGGEPVRYPYGSFTRPDGKEFVAIKDKATLYNHLAGRIRNGEDPAMVLSLLTASVPKTAWENVNDADLPAFGLERGRHPAKLKFNPTKK